MSDYAKTNFETLPSFIIDKLKKLIYTYFNYLNELLINII